MRSLLLDLVEAMKAPMVLVMNSQVVSREEAKGEGVIVVDLVEGLGSAMKQMEKEGVLEGAVVVVSGVGQRMVKAEGIGVEREAMVVVVTVR